MEASLVDRILSYGHCARAGTRLAPPSTPSSCVLDQHRQTMADTTKVLPSGSDESTAESGKDKLRNLF